MTESTRSSPPADVGSARHDVAGKTGPVSRRLAEALVYVAPALLVVVAVQQIILSSTLHLSPWTGGGFGMFSSIDTILTRTVRGSLIVDGREIPIRLGGSDPIGRQALQARALPTRARLDRLAGMLARREWRLDPASGVASPIDGSPAPGVRAIRPSAVRLEIYRILFDPTTLQVERLLLADATGTPP